MNATDTLLCIFSYNMGQALENCIASVKSMCDSFDVVIIDDDSEDEKTREVIESHKDNFLAVFSSNSPKSGRRLGNLYSNIQRICDYAFSQGYSYLFMIQDDTQIVRKLDKKICEQYSRIFGEDERVLQVDPRFLRRDHCIDVLVDKNAYRRDGKIFRTAYSDIGIFKLKILNEMNYVFRENELANKEALFSLGYSKIIPFSPIMMHVPFPKRFREGKEKKTEFCLKRGMYNYHPMSDEEIQKMDQRDIFILPYYKDFLRPRNMNLMSSFYFRKLKENDILS